VLILLTSLVHTQHPRALHPRSLNHKTQHQSHLLLSQRPGDHQPQGQLQPDYQDKDHLQHTLDQQVPVLHHQSILHQTQQPPGDYLLTVPRSSFGPDSEHLTFK
jgi:hypothetical protein